jgi:hypothetical protein
LGTRDVNPIDTDSRLRRISNPEISFLFYREGIV